MKIKKFKKKTAIILIACLLSKNLVSLGDIHFTRNNDTTSIRAVSLKSTPSEIIPDEDEDTDSDNQTPDEDVVKPATPSELPEPDDKEEKPQKATPSEAEPEFSVLEPANTPCYYTKVKDYFTFYGRDNNAYWRIYGDDGDEEGWYSSDKWGTPENTIIDTTEEDLTLAPYRYLSTDVGSEEWKELSKMLYGNANVIQDTGSVVKSTVGNNCDGSTYSVWNITIETEDGQDEWFYFYGHRTNSTNEEDLKDRWYECNEAGDILNKNIYTKELRMDGSISVTPFDGGINVHLYTNGFPFAVSTMGSVSRTLVALANDNSFYAEWDQVNKSSPYMSNIRGYHEEGSNDSRRAVPDYCDYSYFSNSSRHWSDTSPLYEDISQPEMKVGTDREEKEFNVAYNHWTEEVWNTVDVPWCDRVIVEQTVDGIDLKIYNPIPQLSGFALYSHAAWSGSSKEYIVRTTYKSNTNIMNYSAAAHKHSGISQTDPTCTSPGGMTGSCASCGLKVNETIPSLGHSPSANYVTTANNGTHYKDCMRCGTRIETQKNPYKIRFNANGGVGTMADLPMIYDAASNLTGNTFSRQAYLFDGWNTKPDGSGINYTDRQSVSNLTKAYNGNVDLYARWKLNECTITYDINGGGRPISSKKVICKTDIGAEALPQPSRTGYTFLGWSLDKNRPDQLLTVNSQFETISVTAYAQWKPNAYSITFDPQGGSLTDTLKNVYYDTPIGSLPQPQMQGKAFTGWVRNGEKTRAGSIPISESTVLKEEGMSCVATYSATAYMLSFDGNGGSCSAPAVSRAYNQALGDLPAASRTGYLLKGWFTEREGGNQMGSTSGMPAYDLALYAHWYPTTHTIRFDANGGTGAMVPQQMTYDVGKELTANRFINKDHKFVGWNTKQDGTGTPYKDTAPVINLSSNNGAEVVLYAQWERTGALCTFYDWDGSLLGTATFEVGASIQYKEPTRAGYTFAGWEGISGAPLNNITGPGSYKATYRINRYKALFKDDTSQYEIEQEYGQSLGTLPMTEKEGHRFLGWFTEKEGGTAITDATLMPLGGATYYAHYEANRYTLTFHYNGGSEGVASMTAEYGKPVGTLPQSTKTGCVFSGWNIQADMQGQFVDENFKMPAKNMELYAAWDIKKVLCIFLDDNGIEVERLSIPYGGNANPATPIKKGYLFTAWDKSLNNIKDETVFAASFTPISYTIAFNVNKVIYPGAVGNMETIPATYDKIARLPESNYVQEHFKFTGWKQDREGSGNLIVDRANTINLTSHDKEVVTLYAQFSRSESPCSFEDWDGRHIQDELILYGKDAIYSGKPERVGYTFTAWAPEAKNVTEPTIFKAVYRPNNYKITFSANGGIGSMEKQSFTFDIDAALSANLYQKDFYVFKEWNTKADGSGEQFADGQTVVNLTAADKGDVTLYAQWALLYLEGENSTNVRPGPDKILGTADDEIYWNGPDGKPATEDDRLIQPGDDSGSLVDNGNGTNTRPGPDGIFGTHDDENYWNGPDGKPGTEDDQLIQPDNNGGSLVDKGNGTNTRPGPDGIFGTDDDDDYWNGPDGIPGTEDDRLIQPGDNGGSLVDNGNGTNTRPGPDGIFGTEEDDDYWNGPDGIPGTEDDRLIQPGDDGSSLVDKGNGTNTRPGPDGIFGTEDDDDYWNGPDGIPGTEDDQLIRPGNNGGSLVDNANGSNTRPGPDDIFGTEDDNNYWNGPDGKPGTNDDRLIYPGPDDIYGTSDDYYYNKEGSTVYPGPDNIWGTYDDVIVKRKGGGGSGGSSGGGMAGMSTTGLLPKDGQWLQENVNNKIIWSFHDINGAKQTGWAYVRNSYANLGQNAADWFYFDVNGYMKTGWHQDADGLWYYLNEQSDGTQGRMLTGWYQDINDKKWYYLSEKHDGHFGHAVSVSNEMDGVPLSSMTD